MEKYKKPSSSVVEVKPCFLCTSETTSNDRCPKCGSTDFETKEVPDKQKAATGVGLAVLSALLTGNTAHAQMHGVEASHATKKVKVCKKCGHEWE